MVNEDFVELLNSGEAWGFIGTGPSVDAGLRGWQAATDGVAEGISDPALRKRVLEDARWIARMARRDYAGALQVLQDLLGRELLLSSFNAALGAAHVGTIYPIISRWPFRNLVTTNYESLLFDAIRPVEPGIALVDNSESGLASITRNPSNVILRLHGNLQRTESTTVLTQKDYDEAYGPGGRIGQFALKLLKDQRFVFIGFGFNDPDLLRLLRLASNASNPLRPHFAVLGFTDAEFSRHTDLAAEHGVVVIPYRVSADGSHRDLEHVLRAYDWCVVGREGRRSSNLRPARQSSAVTALHIANECLASGSTANPRVQETLRALTLVALRDGPKTVAEISSSIPKLLPIQSPESAPLSTQVDSEIADLITEGKIAVVGKGYELTPEGKHDTEVACAEGERLDRQFRSSIEGRLEPNVQKVDLADGASFVVKYLQESCTKRALAIGQLLIGRWTTGAEFQRANVLFDLPAATGALGNRDLALASVHAIGEVLSAPSEAEHGVPRI